MFRKELINIYLSAGFDMFEATSEVDFVLEVVLKLSSKDILMGFDVAEDDRSEIINLIKKRVESKRPIQQILGRAFFMGEKFFVSEHTLIPRPETEILVLETLKLIEDKRDFKVLDIGSGSGCIPLMLAKNTVHTVIESVDISSEALEVAKSNAVSFSLDPRVKFYYSDLFLNVKGQFDIIVSNPPYIPFVQKDSLQSEVRDFEPKSALFAYDEKGIEFYKSIIESAPKYLNDGGHLLFELGINQADDVKKVLESNNFSNIKIIKDLDNIERVIIAKFCPDR